VKIPAVKIAPIHRSDSSGDTFLFTQYLYDQDPSGVASAGATQLLTWPNVPGSLAESGNAGMQAGCIATPGCVAYIGISYLRGGKAHGLGYASLLNGYKGHGGAQYIVPSIPTINNEVASFKHMPTSGSVSLINSLNSPGGYPIVNFEYAIVKQSNPKAAAVKAFLAWAMDPRGGSSASYLVPLEFKPLPLNALAVAIKLVQSISG
jgi:phosphate transport system substrate-binding protein